jgi:tRNA (cytidine/uridine-2'-O-)-methyltransferase
MRLALYQPDIPQNAGTLLRLGACLGVPVDIIGPARFDVSDRALRRAALDYLTQADFQRHVSWQAYCRWRQQQDAHRLVLVSVRAPDCYTDFAFDKRDILLVGRESAGVPQAVREQADAAVRIPMREGLRSLNVAVAAAMVLGEALRRTGSFPGP